MMSHTSKLCRAVKVRYLITVLGLLALCTVANYLNTMTRSDTSTAVKSYFPNITSVKPITETVRNSQEYQHLSNVMTVSHNILPGRTPVGSVAGYLTSNISTRVSQPRSGVQQFLYKLLAGHWSLRNYTTRELEEVEAFISRTRSYLRIPPSLQRPDNKCGNVNFPGLQWYRAVCNPRGGTPCCMNNTCVNKIIQECQCPGCYDMRQQIHAEFATWIPDNPTVKVSHFTDDTDACPILRNKTIYFIGDSYMRQLYTALLAILRYKNPLHVLKPDTTEATAAKCDKYYRYFADCRHNIILNSDECNRTVKLKMDMSQKIAQSHTIFRLIKALSGKQDSWVVLGIGFHDHLDFEGLKNHVLNPLITVVSNASWPKVIWLPIHSPGILKTPLVETQTAPAILAFNVKVKAYLDAQPILLLDFTKLTNGTMSYDGSHYGSGVNDAKIQILLNYFKEMKQSKELS